MSDQTMPKLPEKLEMPTVKIDDDIWANCNNDGIYYSTMHYLKCMEILLQWTKLDDQNFAMK